MNTTPENTAPDNSENPALPHTEFQSPQYYIGLMTGTSMDGVDAALVQFDADDSPGSLKLVATHSHSIPQELKAHLIALSSPGGNQNESDSENKNRNKERDTIDQLGDTDAQLGELLADAVLALLAPTPLNPNQITAIGSHGQTVRHRPPDINQKYLRSFTLQIGDPNRIVAATNITTVADFRRRDVALGGHGAPLVPAFHQALFRHPDTDRVIVNIGGISNITYLPSQGTVIGFDTGPGNGLLDAWINRHRNVPYDAGGQWAASHTPHPGLLAQLKTHPFFALSPPKSTGREGFNLAWLDHQLSGFEESVEPGVVQSTLLAFTAETIAEAIEETLAQHTGSATEVYICGGGALNTALMDALQKQLAPAHVTSTHNLGIDPEWVEAVAFAWLARQTLLGLPGSLAEVTGATQSAILGAIYPGG